MRKEMRYRGLYVVGISWERIQLKITLVSSEHFINEGVKFFLCSLDSDNSIDISDYTDITYVQDKAECLFNLAIANKGTFIPTGLWSIKAVDAPAGREFTLYISDTSNDCGLPLERTFYKHDDNNIFYRINVTSKPEVQEMLLLDITYKSPRRKKALEMLKKKEIKTALFRIIFYTAQKIFGIKSNRLLLTSDSLREKGGNMFCVYKRIQERRLEDKLEIKTIFKEGYRAKRRLRDIFKLPIYLATSKFILLDDAPIPLGIVEYHKNQELIQMWHASGAFKTVGFSRGDKETGNDLWLNSHKGYTKVIVSSEKHIKYYSEAFGLKRSSFCSTGLPRLDVFYDKAYREAIVNRLRNEIPDICGKSKVILFAPTFRGKEVGKAFYPYNALELSQMHSLAEKHNYVFLMKMHPNVSVNLQIPDEYSKRLIDVFDYKEVNDLLFITDLLITDYSSIVFEASILEIPMLFYAFDLDEYAKRRGFYINYESFVPGRIVTDFESLLMAVSNGEFEAYKVRPFKEEYVGVQCAGASDRIIDELILEEKIQET